MANDNHGPDGRFTSGDSVSVSFPALKDKSGNVIEKGGSAKGKIVSGPVSLDAKNRYYKVKTKTHGTFTAHEENITHDKTTGQAHDGNAQMTEAAALAKIKQLKAKLAKVKAETRAIDRKLQAEDRKDDNPHPDRRSRRARSAEIKAKLIKAGAWVELPSTKGKEPKWITDARPKTQANLARGAEQAAKDKKFWDKYTGADKRMKEKGHGPAIKRALAAAKIRAKMLKDNKPL